jgi:hypothetical protein
MECQASGADSPSFRLAKITTIVSPFSSYSSKLDTSPSSVGLRTTQADLIWSSLMWRLNPSSSTLTQWSVDLMVWTGPEWIWITPVLPTNIVIEMWYWAAM